MAAKSLASAFAPRGVRTRRIKVTTSPGLEQFLERELQAMQIPGQFDAAPGG